jgi:acyl-CoA thioester hydrolase
MGVVYHGNYAQFFEIGRTEAVRHLGLTYKQLEDTGIMMPVVDLHMKYLRPVKYDDLITVTVQLRELPADHRVTFFGEITNEAGKLCCAGTATLYFLDAKTQQRATMPEVLREKLEPYF